MSQNYTLTGIDHKLWIEFKSACAHYNISIRATFIKQIQNIVNDYRLYKNGFTSLELQKPKRRRR